MKQRAQTLYEWLNNNSENQELNKILIQISIACKIISNQIRRASLEKLYGDAEITNFHGENVQTLDVLANHEFIQTLRQNQMIHSLISEESFEVIPCNDAGEYTIAFDPLDGSSNINANISIGSIFSITQNIKDPLFTGLDIISAGYALYSSSTMLVFAIEGQPQGFTLDEQCGEFLLTHPNITIAKLHKIYSVNEAYSNFWSDGQRNLLNKFREDKYVSRYIGSMVADVHRTLLYGGIFMNISSPTNPDGKLRYLYEVAPMSYIIEKAGGLAYIKNKRALEYKPATIHQRSPIYMGSESCVKIALEYF